MDSMIVMHWRFYMDYEKGGNRAKPASIMSDTNRKDKKKEEKRTLSS